MAKTKVLVIALTKLSKTVTVEVLRVPDPEWTSPHYVSNWMGGGEPLDWDIAGYKVYNELGETLEVKAVCRPNGSISQRTMVQWENNFTAGYSAYAGIRCFAPDGGWASCNSPTSGILRLCNIVGACVDTLGSTAYSNYRSKTEACTPK